MYANQINTSISLISKISLPVTLVFIGFFSTLLYWETTNKFPAFYLTILICFALFTFAFSVLIPIFINKNSLPLLVISMVIVAILSTAGLLELYKHYKSGFPYPFNTEPFPDHYIIGISSTVALAIIIAAIGLRLELNTYLISKEGYQLLQKSYQSEINALKIQMNPHFISNSLNNLTRLVKMGEIEKAKQYNSELIALINNQISHTQSEELSLEEEIRWLENYLKTEQKRLNFSFDYDIKVEHPHLLDFTIPPMILQPIVENSIKHGFHPDKFEGKGRLEITINKSHFNSIKISIKDNGLGVNAPKEIKNRPSISTQSIQERIRLLNEISNINININKKFKQNAQGSVYELKIAKGII